MSLLRFFPDAMRRRLIEKTVQPYTLVGPERIQNLYKLARRIEDEKLQGDVVECGVCNGGTAAILGHFATHSQFNRVLWLCDSFEGMPQITPEDREGPNGDSASAHVGKEVGDVGRVREVLRRTGCNMERVRLVKGWYSETFPTLTVSNIALLNIDADWYESVTLCLETLYDKVSPGGFISVDDYGHWPGCKQAVDEFFERRQLSYRLADVDYTARWFQKL